MDKHGLQTYQDLYSITHIMIGCSSESTLIYKTHNTFSMTPFCSLLNGVNVPQLSPYAYLYRQRNKNIRQLRNPI